MQSLTRLFTLAITATALVIPTSGMAEKRSALVIGNSAYEYASPLANPVNDAKAMSVKLQQLGFTVVEGFDLTNMETQQVVRAFSKEARDSDINLLFYAGHGMAVNGTNYIIPIDARLEDETALDFEAVEVDFITRMMSYSDSANLVFLDACRDNPLSRTLTRSLGGGTRSINITPGLAEMRTPSTGKGLAIAFSTSPGEVALDGDGVNSPFTASLLRHIDTPNADISTVLSRVVGDVWESTDEGQRPWLSSSLTGSVILNPKTVLSDGGNAAATDAPASTAASATAMLEEQKLLFELARESDLVEDYQAYLDTFPDGLFANNARRAVQRLQDTGTVQTAALSPQTTTNNSRSAQIVETGALSLQVTPEIRGLPATQGTEALLDLDRQKRGEIQSRLNAANANVGGVDGQWGAKTRRGIATWQAMNGLPASGYFNAPQLELLVTQTEGRFVPYTAPVATAKSSGGARATTSRQNTQRTTQRTTTRRQVSGHEVGAVLQGMGSLLNAIKK